MTAFQELHESPTPFLLPNAWDVGSAIAFVAAGFPAVGTTSFGVAASQGMPDAGRASRAGTLALVAQLSRFPILVSADIEDGYCDDPAEVARLVADLADAGLAGINLEDSFAGHLADAQVPAAKIAAIKAIVPEVFINARIDNFWFSEQATVAAVVQRARIYADAGADGIFVPGLSSAEDIRAIAAALTLPLNVLAHPTLTAEELGHLGVRRISSGSLPYRAAVDAALRVATTLRDGKLPPKATSYGDMQALLEAFHAAGAQEHPTAN